MIDQTINHCGLHRSAKRNDLIRVDLLMRWDSHDTLHKLLNVWNPTGTAHHQHAVNVIRRHLRIVKRFVNSRFRLLDNRTNEGFEGATPHIYL